MIGKKFCFIAGGIVLIYGIIILILLGAGRIFNFFFPVLGLLLLLVGFLNERIRAWKRWIRITIGVILAVFLADLIWFLISAISMSVKGAAMKKGEWDWVIVLGAKVDEKGVPKQEYAVRLDKAEELCGDSTSLILTGGRGSDEPVTEAEGGEQYLLNRGRLKTDQIYLEKESTNTSENLTNARKIIRENGGSENDKVLIVSSGFHLFRASKMAQKLGFTNAEYAGSTGLKILLPYSYAHEYLAYVWSRFTGTSL